MVHVGRNLWVHLAQQLLKQRHPEQGALAHNQESSENLQGRESTAIRASAPTPTQHRSAVWCSGGISCVPVCVVLALASVFFAPSLQVFLDMDKIPARLFSKLSSHTSLSLSS